MTVTATAARRWRPVALAALAGAMIGAMPGCGDGPAAECQGDLQCGMGFACVASTCVARIEQAGTWSLDVVPDPQSPLAPREYPAFTFTRDPVTLMADRKVGMATSLARSYPDAGTTATSVHLVLAVPSAVPGRGELQFEADAVNTGMSTPYETTLPVPERLLGAPARLWVAPRAPLSRQMCPWQFEVTIEPRRAVALPGPEDTTVLEGVLLNGDGTPVADYEARVVLGGRLSSNLARTDATGKFVLRIQRSLVAQAPGLLGIELAPIDGGQPRPTLTVEVAAGQPIGTLRLPPASPSVAVMVPVMEELGGRPVAGATVQMQATLPGAVGGVARYIRTAQTGSDGRATLPLLAAAPGADASYLVKIVPPAGAASGARCLPGYAIPSTDATFPLPAVNLPPKVTVEGVVTQAGGLPARGMTVRATRRGDLFKEECLGDLASPPTETRTGAGGNYRLLLDPGDYRLDYQPDRGTALPHHVEDAVSLRASATRDIRLPAPVMVEGQVTSPEGVGLGKAEVRVFGAGPEAASVLRGVAATGSDGRFRLLLPAPGSGP